MDLIISLEAVRLRRRVELVSSYNLKERLAMLSWH
jgi:hypothetical protein